MLNLDNLMDFGDIGMEFDAEYYDSQFNDAMGTLARYHDQNRKIAQLTAFGKLQEHRSQLNEDYLERVLFCEEFPAATGFFSELDAIRDQSFRSALQS